MPYAPETLPTSETASDVLPKSTKPPSPLLFKRRTLGDKLQAIQRLSPSHLVAIEVLVDQILRRLDWPRFIFLGLSLFAF